MSQRAPEDALVSLDRVAVNRPGGGVLFRDLSWTVRVGETWAVTGPVGSGKSTLVELLLGRRRPDSGSIAWPFLDHRPVPIWPGDAIHRVAFTGSDGRFSPARHYYQQRFNFVEAHDDLTLETFLGGASPAEIRAVAARLGIEALLPLSLIKLSNGQARRARLARALLAKPEWLLLDDPFLGLDAAGRSDTAEWLGGLIRQGLPVLLVARRTELPPWVTHVLELGSAQNPSPFSLPSPTASGGEGLGVRGVAAEMKNFCPLVLPSPPASGPEGPGVRRVSAPVVELRNATVAYDGRPILNDVSWTVRAGERWAVLGPNGSGKSTLLSLLCGDHPQAYSNDVRIFGRRRGTGDSIWDVKRRIGLVSPELHVYFSGALTAFETAATGFFDVLAHRPTSPEQEAIVRDLFDQFGLTGLAGRSFARLSTGEQRLVLLVRALVKSPPLLILDEPFQGLDAPAIALARNWLDQRLRPEQTLLFVSHYAEEVPAAVTRRLRLEAGRVVGVSN